MKSIILCIITLAFLVPSAVLAVGKYDREKICPKEKDNFSACDLLVEQAVAKDIPGVIERKGAVLRIHLRNGKIMARKNVRTAADCDSCHENWVCNYLPNSGYLEICQRGWWWSAAKFVNIQSGSSGTAIGRSSYSPLGRRALMVELSDDSGVTGVEIWRFDSKRPVKEFELKYSSEEDEEEFLGYNLAWEDAVWKSETEIQIKGSLDSQENPSSGVPLSSYRLVKEGHTWKIEKN
ncbi:hypothetical protein VU08_07355 [Desulfobulbus sp. F5]|nr:hypothetical protein [Desulfobulbus sp. F5]